MLSGAFFGILIHMDLYLLSCQSIQQYAERILPLLPEQRRLAYACSSSPLTLGAGLLLSRIFGVHADKDLFFGPQGKPFLAARKPCFSLSHSGAHVLMGVSDSLIGVDMERMERRVPPAVQERICLPQEKGLPPLQVFTRKECAMKLTGLGFSLPIKQIDTTNDFAWEGMRFRYFTTACEGYLISVLTAETALPEIQQLTPEALL